MQWNNVHPYYVSRIPFSGVVKSGTVNVTLILRNLDSELYTQLFRNFLVELWKRVF